MKLFRTLRRLSTKERLNLVFQAYKSLSNFSRRIEGPSSIAKRLGLKQQTVSAELIRFKRCKMDLVSFIHKRKPAGRTVTPIGNEEIEKELLSPTCLKAWAQLSIVQRCEQIWQKYKVQVKRHKLTSFYQRNGIRCAPTYNKYYPHGHNLDQLKFRRMEFA